MIMAVVLFFVLAGLFFVGIKYREMYQTATYFGKEKAKSMASKLSETPEFNCGEPNCIDLDICTKNNYPECGRIIIQESSGDIESVSSFVALCRKEVQGNYIYDKCELGKIVDSYKVEQGE